LKVLSFSYCFPNAVQPAWGMFVKQRLAALSQIMDLQVISPIPYFPLLAPFGRLAAAGSERLDGLTVHRPRFFYIPGVFKSWDARWYARGLKGWLTPLIRDFQPDLLDAHFIWPDGVGVSRLARSLGLPYVITQRGKIYPCLEVVSQRRQCAEALQNAAAVINVSGELADIARRLDTPAERIHVIPNGVDTVRFRPRDKKMCRLQLGLPEEGRLIVTVAHLGPRKGHWETVRALSRLSGDVRLVIVGGDMQGGKNERALRNYIDGLHLTDRVFLPGAQPYDKIPLYFNAADVSVLASYREGCPNVVLESLASGTPVVASRVGAVPDILPVPEYGRIVPPCDAEALTEALQEVLQAEWLPEKIAPCPAVQSWDRVAREVEKVFVRVLHPSSSAGKMP